MKESVPSSNPESQEARARRLEREYKKRYEALPAAKPRLFIHPRAEGEGDLESVFVFPPITVSITKENIEELTAPDRYTENEIMALTSGDRLNKLRANENVYGEYEISCVMRMEGNTHRIDKMIAELDTENPWQAGKIEHLLLLALQSPELIDGPTVALGSELKQNGNIPCLEKREGRLSYVNHPRAAGFNNNYRFLVVRKKG